MNRSTCILVKSCKLCSCQHQSVRFRPRRPHEVLGVKNNASKEEIKSAYKELSKKFHPDINPTQKAHEKFIEINEAYNTLSSGKTAPQTVSDEKTSKDPSDIGERLRRHRDRKSQYSRKADDSAYSDSWNPNNIYGTGQWGHEKRAEEVFKRYQQFKEEPIIKTAEQLRQENRRRNVKVKFDAEFDSMLKHEEETSKKKIQKLMLAVSGGLVVFVGLCYFGNNFNKMSKLEQQKKAVQNLNVIQEKWKVHQAQSEVKSQGTSDKQKVS